VEVRESLGLGENDVSIPVGGFWAWSMLLKECGTCTPPKVMMETVVEGEYVVEQEVQG